MSASIEKRIYNKTISLFRKHWLSTICLVVVGATATLIGHILFPKYIATSILHVRSVDESPLLKSIGKISGVSQWNQYSIQAPSEKYIKVLKSTAFVNFVQEKIDLMLNSEEKAIHKAPSYVLAEHLASSDGAAIALFGGVVISARDDLIELTSYASKKEDAQRGSALMAELAQQYIVHYELKDIEDANTYLREQLKTVQERIDGINKQIEIASDGEDFMRVFAGGGIESYHTRNLGRLKEEEQITGYKLSEAEALVKQFSKQMGVDPGRVTASDSDDGIMRGRMADKIRMLSDEIQILKTRKDVLGIKINELSGGVKSMVVEKFNDLKRKLDLEHNLYQEIQRQIFDNQVYKISVENQIRQYKMATLDSVSRESSLKYKLALATMMTIIVTVLSALIWETLFPVVSNRKQLIDLGVKFLGTVPNVSDFHKTTAHRSFFRKLIKTTNQNLLHNPRVRNKVTTTFQFLGNRIIQTLVKINSKRAGVLSLVSQRTGEGKSVLSVNLGIVLSSFGIKTLLIDGDWFKKSTMSYLGIERSEGLIEVLTEDLSVDSAIHTSSYANLFYLSPGLKQKTLDIGKENRFFALLTKLRNDYDIIIVDTPAFEVGTEGLSMCRNTDLSIVVTQSDRTPIDDVAELVEVLTLQDQSEIYGVINGVEAQASFSEAYYDAYTPNEEKHGA